MIELTIILGNRGIFIMSAITCFAYTEHATPCQFTPMVAKIAAFGFLGVVAIAGLLPALAKAGSSDAKLTVTATVMKHASLTVLAQPASVVVTAADIVRGYVDVPSPAHVAIWSNSQSGYMLMFASEGEFLRQTLIRGLGNDVQLDTAGGGVARRPEGRGMSKATLDLVFRFVLSSSAKQGVYAWPMRLSVSAL